MMDRMRTERNCAMPKYTVVVAFAFFLVSHSSVWAKGKKVPVECLARNTSLTVTACEVRLLPGAPILPVCANLSGAAYRTCAAQMPSDEILDQQRQERERKRLSDQALHNELAPKLKAIGLELSADAIRLPTPPEAIDALTRQKQSEGTSPTSDEMMKAYNDAAAAEAKAVNAGLSAAVDPSDRIAIEASLAAAKRAAESKVVCPDGVKPGITRAQLYACKGYPDHTNSDFYADQLVYPDGSYVYIDRATDRVDNMQWSH